MLLLLRSTIVIASLSVVAAQDTFTCLSGFKHDEVEVTITPDKVNDGYCDCPLDGMDEPNTEACAGSTNWSGIGSISEADEDKGTITFPCPQQPNLIVPVSRVHDGVCDCCDGADEEKGKCEDICDFVLFQERAALQAARESFAKGSAKRELDIVEYQNTIRETKAKIKNLESNEITSLEKEQSRLQVSIKALKTTFVTNKIKAFVQSVGSFTDTTQKGADRITVAFRDAFEQLNLDELYTLIVYVCQLAGELGHSQGLPLRIAGYHLGILWENENPKDRTADIRRISLEEEDGTLEFLADKILQVTKSSESAPVTKNPPPKKEKPKRRHSHRAKRRAKEVDDDELLQDDDEDFYQEDDDFVEEYEVSPPASEKESMEIDEQLIEDCKLSLLSIHREHFLIEAASLVNKIEELSKLDEDEADTEKATEEESPVNIPSFDPMALPTVKRELLELKKKVERGYEFGSTAIFLLDALDKADESVPSEESRLKQDLVSLAAATIYYSGVALQDIAELLYVVAPETNEDILSNYEQQIKSCVVPILVPCNKLDTIEKNGRIFPPEIFLNSVKQLCDRMMLPTPDLCPYSATDSIPNSVHDGFLGYRHVQSAADGDEVLQLFQAPQKIQPPLTELEPLSTQLKQTGSKLRSTQSQIDNMTTEIAEDKYGKDGELYAIRDECLTIQQGKYEYRLCIFGSSSQRDTSSKSGKTDLGKWEDIEIDRETGERTLTWTEGAKCWNGPKRSATLHLTCGGETKLLTADEPDTCRYVFTGTSHIACDEISKAHNRL